MKVAALLALCLSATPPLHAQDCEITQERLEALFAEALPAVEEALGMELAQHVRPRLASIEEVAGVIARENGPLLRAQLGDSDELESQSQAIGDVIAQALLAKYAWSTSELLLVAENFSKISALIGRPELCADETVRALLVHELVHAHDHRRFRFDTVLSKLEEPDRIQAYNAVIEGHAQHRARRICAARGWSEGFETFNKSIGAAPETASSEGPAFELLMKFVAATLAASYFQGERFIAAIEEAGGTDAIARAFAEPPRDMEVVYRPEWFLDPSLRPVASCDFEGALALAQQSFPESEWQGAVTTMTSEQLRVATSMIPAEAAERMLEGLIANRVMVFGSRSDPQSKQTIFVLYEFRTPEAATWFVAGEELVMRTKDEQMKSGTIHVESARYEPFTRGSSIGFVAHKQMRVGTESAEIVALCAGRGRLVAEAMFVGDASDDEEHILLADALLQRASGEANRLPGATLFTFEDLEPGPLPEGWTAAASEADATPNAWHVVEESGAPSGARVLALTTDNAGSTFNLLFAPGEPSADVELSVALRALSGEEDQGGGLVWRAQDQSNYYLARWNPLEQNVRIYIVQDGSRRGLESVRTELDAATWHYLGIVVRGTTMRVLLDGAQVLSVEDGAIPGAGRVGLWTKADASTAFDDLSIAPAAD